MIPENIPTKPPSPICKYCKADLAKHMSLNMASIGPFQVVTLFCGACRKLFNTQVIGAIQPQVVQPTGIIPPGRLRN